MSYGPAYFLSTERRPGRRRLKVLWCALGGHRLIGPPLEPADHTVSRTCRCHAVIEMMQPNA